MNSEDLDILLELWHPKSFVADEKCYHSLKKWLSSGSYLLNDKNPDISIFCPHLDDLKKCFSLDAFQFSLRTAQTVSEFERSTFFLKMTSWSVIKIYYAAFFAAHAALRFFGRSFSYLESNEISPLTKRCNLECGYNPSLSTGYYLISLDDKNNLEFKKFSESHKDLWKNFLDLLKDISVQSLSLRASDARRQSLSTKFSDIADALNDNAVHNFGNFLSQLRNEVNYKSIDVAWYPFSRDTPEFQTLMSRARGWASCQTMLEDPRNLDNRYERFFATAFLIIDLGLSIAVSYSKQISKPGARSKNFSQLINLCAG